MKDINLKVRLPLGKMVSNWKVIIPGILTAAWLCLMTCTHSGSMQNPTNTPQTEVTTLPSTPGGPSPTPTKGRVRRSLSEQRGSAPK
jgi:hypothetical protein